ncbi:hypothetical protein D9M72_510040 [compost metagenome]
MHHELAQRAGAHQGRDALQQFAGNEGRHRAAVLHDVLELLAHQHGVDRHEDCVGPQDGEVGSDELRAILAEDEHAVSGRHLTHTLQVASHGFGLGQQLGIAHGLAEELHRGLGGVTAGRGLEVAEQAGLGDVGLARQAATGARRVDAQGAAGALDHAGGRGARVSCARGCMHGGVRFCLVSGMASSRPCTLAGAATPNGWLRGRAPPA